MYIGNGRIAMVGYRDANVCKCEVIVMTKNSLFVYWRDGLETISQFCKIDI
jgi:hypothetical protein